MKITIILTDKEIMKALDKKRSTYYQWKKNRPKEYELIREALVLRKFNILLENDRENSKPLSNKNINTP